MFRHRLNQLHQEEKLEKDLWLPQKGPNFDPVKWYWNTEVRVFTYFQTCQKEDYEIICPLWHDG